MISLNQPLETRWAAGLGVAVVLSTFLLDLSQPVGVAVGIPYVTLPLLGLLARSPRAVIALAAIGTVFSGIGLLLSPAGVPLAFSLINRVMSTILIWIVAAVVIRHLLIGDHLRRTLENQAALDPLTGLYNRRYIFDIVETELKRFRRYGQAFALMLIDADHFKRVNDRHGHCAGDAALRLISDVCTDSVRETDVVGRFGGEEFIILLPHTGTSDALRVAERIRSAVRTARLEWEGQSVRVTLSLGVAEAAPSVDTFDALLRSADRALYAAKRNGRDQVAAANATPTPAAPAPRAADAPVPADG